jgi:hypothetical protein
VAHPSFAREAAKRLICGVVSAEGERATVAAIWPTLALPMQVATRDGAFHQTTLLGLVRRSYVDSLRTELDVLVATKTEDGTIAIQIDSGD